MFKTFIIGPLIICGFEFYRNGASDDAFLLLYVAGCASAIWMTIHDSEDPE
jgi:hypothetical protein